jgi:hypothetical protein
MGKKKSFKQQNKPVSQPFSFEPFFAKHEGVAIFLLCVVAGLRIFIFAAAFPFFNNVDEQAHFDLIFKYAHGLIPHKLENFSTGSSRLIVLHGSPEYLNDPNQFPYGRIPPPTRSLLGDPNFRIFQERMITFWSNTLNHETTQPPIYYLAAAFWYDLGKAIGFDGGQELYWLRFLNVFVYVILLWVSYFYLKNFFPSNTLLRFGVPLMLVVFPQDVMYTINNDILSPLFFTMGFFGLIGIYQSESKSYQFYLMTGLMIACAFLTKMTNVALLILFGIFLLLQIRKVAQSKKWRTDLPKIVIVFSITILPIAFWLIRNYFVLDDITGSSEKIKMLGWTTKPLGEIWNHPIFSWHGIITFWNDLMATFWRGELVWFKVRLASYGFDLFYSVSSFLFVTTAGIGLILHKQRNPAVERVVSSASILVIGLSIAFLIVISVSYDFDACWYPSRDYPYMTSGRLISGMVVPFLILYLNGLDYVLSKFGLSRYRAMILLIIAVLITVSEVVLSYPVFKSQYNWFHLP